MSAPSSFTEAQQRIHARRALTEAAASRRELPAPHQRPLLPHSRFNRLLNAIAPSSDGRSTQPAYRVGQVDAELLDEELVETLRNQLGDSLKYLGSDLKDQWSAEIQLALRAILFKLTVWDHNATYGAALQNLQYTDARQKGPVRVPPTRMQKTIYGLVTVVGRYAWNKWETWLLDHDDGIRDSSPRIRRLSQITDRISTLHAAAALASFLVFLLDGRYRTLLDRILRMRLAPPTSQVSREVSFEYQNRQLVWHAFTEFLLFVLPLVGIHRWKRWFTRTWRKTREIMRTGTADGDAKKEGGELGFLPERTCAICYQDQNSVSNESEALAAAAGGGGVVGSAQTDITNPYEAVPCGCIYCYDCIANRLRNEEGDGWICLRCGTHIVSCKAWDGDVLPESGAGSNLENEESQLPGSGCSGLGNDGGRPVGKSVTFSDDV